MAEVVLMVVTLDRYDLTVKCVNAAINKAGIPYGDYWELLSVDNGSEDKRVPDFMKDVATDAYRLDTNLGYAPAINQMMLARPDAKYYCVLDPDIMVPDGWLRKLVEVNKAIPWSGVSSFHCVEPLPPAIIMEGMCIHPHCSIFGIKFMSARMLKDIGPFCEDYAPYGLEDRDMLHRVWHSGYMSYYVGNDLSMHLGNDVSDNSPYRQHKWDCLKRVSPILDRNLARYDETQNYRIGWPTNKGWFKRG